MQVLNAVCGTCNRPIHKAPSALKGSKSGKVFCSHSCSQQLANSSRTGKSHYSWRTPGKSYRHRALVEQGLRCANKDCPLERANVYLPEKLYDVDHINNNHSDNRPENLQVLCIYCHAVKTRNVSP